MRSGLIAINLAAIIFGSAALFGKLDISPFWIVTMRAAFASLALLVFGLMRGSLKPWPRIAQWKALVVTGVVLAVHWLTFFASVQLAGVAIATLTFATFPLFTVFLETFRAGRRPLALEVGAGVAIVAAVGLLVDLSVPGMRLLGAMAGLVSAVSFAYYGSAAKPLTAAMAPITVSLAQNIIVAVCVAPALPFVSPTPNSLSDWLWLLALGVVTTALMHQLYLFALKRLSAMTCSGFVALEPVYAVAFAALFFGEPLTPWVVVSGTLIVGASLLLLRIEQKPAIA